MSTERRPLRVRSTADEPAAAGDRLVPDVESWQRAADRGAEAQIGAEAALARRVEAATLPEALRDELVDTIIRMV